MLPLYFFSYFLVEWSNYISPKIVMQSHGRWKIAKYYLRWWSFGTLDLDFSSFFLGGSGGFHNRFHFRCFNYISPKIVMQSRRRCKIAKYYLWWWSFGTLDLNFSSFFLGGGGFHNCFHFRCLIILGSLQIQTHRHQLNFYWADPGGESYILSR